MTTLGLDLLKELIRVRCIEEVIVKYYGEQEMRTPCHLSIGQEAVSVGVCHCLEDEDYVFSSHRSHAAYLAKKGDGKALLAELYGKTTGTNQGLTGSAHISSHEAHTYSGSILGGMIPVAVGAAYGFKMENKPNIAAAFFGDAAVEEGVFAESVNFAVLKKIPVLLVCENNQFSTSTHIRYRQPERPIFEMVRAMGIKSIEADGNDVLEVCALAQDLILRCREQSLPAFMECHTYRFREHVGPEYDFYNPYRTEEEVKAWIRRCPIKGLTNQLIQENRITLKDVDKIHQHFMEKAEEAVRFAKESPWPGVDSLLEHVR